MFGELISSFIGAGIGISLAFPSTSKKRKRYHIENIATSLYSCLIPKSGQVSDEISSISRLPLENYQFLTPDGKCWQCFANQREAIEIHTIQQPEQQQSPPNEYNNAICSQHLNEMVFLNSTTNELIFCRSIEQSPWIIPLTKIGFTIDDSIIIDDTNNIEKLSPSKRLRLLDDCLNQKNDSTISLTKQTYSQLYVERPNLLLSSQESSIGDLYAICRNGSITLVKNCLPHQRFDSNSAQCQDVGICYQRPNYFIIDKIVLTAAEGNDDNIENKQLLDDEWYECYNEKVIKRHCFRSEEDDEKSSTQFFDRELRQCIDRSLCFQQLNGTRFPHPEYSSRFFECFGGNAIQRQCPTNSIFQNNQCRDITCLDEVPLTLSVERNVGYGKYICSNARSYCDSDGIRRTETDFAEQFDAEHFNSLEFFQHNAQNIRAIDMELLYELQLDVPFSLVYDQHVIRALNVLQDFIGNYIPLKWKQNMYLVNLPNRLFAGWFDMSTRNIIFQHQIILDERGFQVPLPDYSLVYWEPKQHAFWLEDTVTFCENEFHIFDSTKKLCVEPNVETNVELYWEESQESVASNITTEEETQVHIRRALKCLSQNRFIVIHSNNRVISLKYLGNTEQLSELPCIYSTYLVTNSLAMKTSHNRIYQLTEKGFGLALEHILIYQHPTEPKSIYILTYNVISKRRDVWLYHLKESEIVRQLLWPIPVTKNDLCGEHYSRHSVRPSLVTNIRHGKEFQFVASSSNTGSVITCSDQYVRVNVKQYCTNSKEIFNELTEECMIADQFCWSGRKETINLWASNSQYQCQENNSVILMEEDDVVGLPLLNQVPNTEKIVDNGDSSVIMVWDNEVEKLHQLNDPVNNWKPLRHYLPFFYPFLQDKLKLLESSSVLISSEILN